MPIQLLPIETSGAKIKVVGVGGGGGNIINSMVDKGIEGVEFIAINTDLQALEISKADIKIQIGKSVTKGLGTGMNNDVGEKSAEESREEIARALAGSDMVFITAGMGGGTGTGASPIVARVAKSIEALVVAIVTKPFHFEARPRMLLADQGIDKLKREVDSLIVIPNQRIVELMPKDCSKNQAFAMANKVLYSATKGISQIITKTGEINVDFADVRTTMKSTGDAMIGTGIAAGEDRAIRAVTDALSNPILEDINITGARNVLVNIASNGNILFEEINKINDYVYESVGDKANYIFGIVDDKEMDEQLMVTVIATGFRKEEEALIEDNATANAANSDILAQTGKITSLPTTTEKLKELDVPSVFRRYPNGLVNEDLSDKQTKKENKFDKYGLDSFNLDEAKPPAFLRRSLD
ncbi:MAG: cell division protein FtsZ [Ignavibacteria bacterium]|nr:cell division protein FtsZ [Ignavibacteria bacterium]